MHPLQQAFMVIRDTKPLARKVVTLGAIKASRREP